jgi:hypothetical protein
MERLSLKNDDAQRHIVIGINWCFPRPFIAKRKPSFLQKSAHTPHNADAQSLPAYAFTCDSLSKRPIHMLLKAKPFTGISD